MPFPLWANLAPKNSLVNRRAVGFAARGLWVTRSVLAAVASVAGSFCAVAKLSAGVVLVFVKKKNVLVEVERGSCQRPANVKVSLFLASKFRICLASQRTETSGLPVTTANLLNFVSTLFHQTLDRRFVDCTLGATKACSNR